MKTVSDYSSAFGRAMERSASSIVALSDGILNVCSEHDLQLDWRIDRCLVRSPGSEWEEVANLRVRKAVFRAILARIAVLCRERSSNEMSQYGGQGELAVGENPTVFRVILANTPDDQRLQLLPANEPPPIEPFE